MDSDEETFWILGLLMMLGGATLGMLGGIGGNDMWVLCTLVGIVQGIIFYILMVYAITGEY